MIYKETFPHKGVTYQLVLDTTQKITLITPDVPEQLVLRTMVANMITTITDSEPDDFSQVMEQLGDFILEYY